MGSYWSAIALIVNLTEVKRNKEVIKPSIVIDYNHMMGGFDLKDHLLRYYLVERKNCISETLYWCRNCDVVCFGNYHTKLNYEGEYHVSIGDVTKEVKPAVNPQYVPLKYCKPGPLRRQLAMQYLEMTGRELEYVALSRDTTEADLKQRREILNGTAKYFDQEHSKEELDRWNLVRVSEDFRVIALGIPVPKYVGNPLDPPLRSRFQARDISGHTFKVEEILPDEEYDENLEVTEVGKVNVPVTPEDWLDLIIY
ncbi:hypothetical protein C0J52_04471 [Blattella germanica]|nr:hypothetical protein C0J52_04471 [Blattella germanica]